MFLDCIKSFLKLFTNIYSKGIYINKTQFKYWILTIKVLDTTQQLRFYRFTLQSYIFY